MNKQLKSLEKEYKALEKKQEMVQNQIQKIKNKEYSNEQTKLNTKIKKELNKMPDKEKIKILKAVVTACSHESLCDDDYFDNFKEKAALIVKSLETKGTL